MPVEPKVKRTIAFFDGQNLYKAAKRAFGYTFPNFDPMKLAQAVCATQGWRLDAVRFYTGVPVAGDPYGDRWHHFWTAKLGALGAQGAHVFSLPLRPRQVNVDLKDGSKHTVNTFVEKGIDVQIALDVMRLAYTADYDVGLIFSQDQDLNQVAHEVRNQSIREKRWLQLASAFPVGPETTYRRGIDRTQWVQISKTMYDACIDPKDYRPKKKP